MLLGFGPLVDHRGVGFGPWWTEKIGLYSRKLSQSFHLADLLLRVRLLTCFTSDRVPRYVQVWI